MTPEGKIKAKVREILAEHGVYLFQPVQWGMGATGLDFHCVAPPDGKALFIETKAPGKVPTARQEVLIAKLRKMGAKVFVISNDVTLAELKRWLDEHSRTSATGKD